MKMCPRCNVELRKKNLGSVEVEECTKCKGTWFDTDELRQAKDAADPDVNWLDFEIWKHEDQFVSKGSPLVCALCRKPTVSLIYGDTGVEIDYCPACQGIWLDKGEFKKIVDSLEKEVNSKSFSEYVRESLQEAKEIVTGPESFLSEWKDFTTALKLMQYRLFVENPDALNKLIAFQRANPLK